MKIRYAPYELTPRTKLGVARAGKRQGALLAVETQNGVGYADLHPWEELGDAPLSRQLELLRQGELTALTRNSVAIAHRDAEARARGKSLFDGLAIPPSHSLLNEGESFESAYEHGFRLFKIKLAKASDFKTPPSDVRVRLDFNGRLTPSELREFARQLDPSKIAFIEDPCPWTPEGWEKLPVRLALDRGAHVAEARNWPEVIVIKPAIGDPQALAKNARSFVVTSYLDHPIGQASAAIFAAEAARDYPSAIEPCGLLSHTAYDTTEFSERIRAQGPRMLAPEGTGLGFDDLLAKQDWRAL